MRDNSASYGGVSLVEGDDGPPDDARQVAVHGELEHGAVVDEEAGEPSCVDRGARAQDDSAIGHLEERKEIKLYMFVAVFFFFFLSFRSGGGFY